MRQAIVLSGDLGEGLPPRRKKLALAISTSLMWSMLACGSSSKTTASAITVTDPTGAVSGQLSVLAVGGTANLSMTPGADPLGTGVSWALTCGGSPTNGSISGGACGTLSPAHTPNGIATLYTAPSAVPLGNTVTVTAAVTSDPSASSSVTLTITAGAIAIAFSSTPPTSLSTGASTTVAAQLTHDTTSGGIAWTVKCGSADCGSFALSMTTSSAYTTYTAPSTVPTGGTVTIAATSVADSTKAVSATVTIVPSALPIAVTLAPATLTLGPRSTASLIANVANDASNAGVAWSVTCAATTTTGNCGTFSAAKTVSGAVVTYKAPSTAAGVNPVTIAATAIATAGSAQPASATSNATVTTAATISISLTAQMSALTPLATTALTASVTNDASNAGVTWGISCNGSAGACGTISAQAGSGAAYTATYIAPASIPPVGQVIVSATSNAAANAPASASIPNNPGLATLTLVPVPPTVAYLQSPPSTLVAGGQAQVSAFVANDVAPGGVTWTVVCGSTVAGACGFVSPYQTPNATNAIYTAPPFPPVGTTTGLVAGQVAIVATSISAPAVSVTSVPITITPSTTLSVRFIPSAPSQVQAGTTVNLSASVINDSTNSGIDWQVCASGCGVFTITPAIPAIQATATTPYVPAVPAVTATTVSAWPSALPLPYTAPVTPPASGTATITATAHADGRTSSVASVAIATQSTGPQLQGVALAGTQPVVGSSVALYAAGTSGYGSAATLLYSPLSSPFAITDKGGNFTLPAGYSCPLPNSQVYLVASGGQVGTYGPNPNLTLMTALGPCSSLSSTPVVLNEVTTVASAWALANFASNDSLTGNSSYLYLGSSSSNTTGLANAFASVNNLVDITTGQPLFTVPAGNATVPYAEINTLADALNTCTASAGGVEGDSSACGALFTAADPLQGNAGAQFNATPPADTVQAAIDIAQHPEDQGFLQYTVEVSALFGLATPASPFQPTLNAAPSDFSISLNFTGGGGLNAASAANFMALDGSGNLWLTDTIGNRAIEWNNQGVPVSPSTGFATGSLIAPGPLAIDTSGDIWICDANGLTVIDGLGTEIPGSPFIGGGLTGACQAMAFDGLGNLWANNTASVSKLNNLGVPLSPSGGYTIPVSPTNPALVNPLPILAIDDANNVWLGVTDDLTRARPLYLAELDNGSGSPNFLFVNSGAQPPSNYTQGYPSNLSETQIAIDSAGDVLVPGGGTDTGMVNEVPAYAGSGTTDVAKNYFDGSQNPYPLSEPRGIAIDGARLSWVASVGGESAQPPGLPAGLAGIAPSSKVGSYAFYESPSLSNRALLVAIDGSGNVWVLLNNNTITEYVGLAAPVVTPQSLAVKNKKLGAEP